MSQFKQRFKYTYNPLYFAWQVIWRLGWAGHGFSMGFSFSPSFSWTHAVPPTQHPVHLLCAAVLWKLARDDAELLGIRSFFKDKSSLVWCTDAVRKTEYQGEGLEIFLAFPAHISSWQNLGYDAAEIKWPKGFWILLCVSLSSRPSSNAAVSQLVCCPFQLLCFGFFCFYSVSQSNAQTDHFLPSPQHMIENDDSNRGG